MESISVNSNTLASLESNNEDIRNIVLDSYKDMLAGNGRNYKEFFSEMESRYKDAKI